MGASHYILVALHLSSPLSVSIPFWKINIPTYYYLYCMFPAYMERKSYFNRLTSPRIPSNVLIPLLFRSPSLPYLTVWNFSFSSHCFCFFFPAYFEGWKLRKLKTHLLASIVSLIDGVARRRTLFSPFHLFLSIINPVLAKVS